MYMSGVAYGRVEVGMCIKYVFVEAEADGYLFFRTWSTLLESCGVIFISLTRHTHSAQGLTLSAQGRGGSYEARIPRTRGPSGRMIGIDLDLV